MNCEKLTQELITYLDGRMHEVERRETEEHLRGCATCRERAEQFRRVWTAMDEVPVIDPSFGFDARVRQRVAAEPGRNWFGWFVPQARLAFSAVLLIALTVWIAKRPSGNPGTPGPMTEQDFNAIKDLGVLENYDVVTKMDALSELVPAVDQPTQNSEAEPTQSND
ncbi:MAG TPA: zf-HC2 domain-containing protein [Candidatus Acidoferrales bacterium]|nr:zf-HC2 domain-containing protein [Candidatus Acidoferrales bacterium]